MYIKLPQGKNKTSFSGLHEGLGYMRIFLKGKYFKVSGLYVDFIHEYIGLFPDYFRIMFVNVQKMSLIFLGYM